MNAYTIFLIVLAAVAVVAFVLLVVGYKMDWDWSIVPGFVALAVAFGVFIIGSATFQSSAWNNPDLAVAHKDRSGLASLSNVVSTETHTSGSYFLFVGNLESETSDKRYVNYIKDEGNDYTLHRVKLNNSVHLHETAKGSKPYMTVTTYTTKASSWWPFEEDRNYAAGGKRYDFWVPKGTITGSLTFDVDNSK